MKESPSATAVLKQQNPESRVTFAWDWESQQYKCPLICHQASEWDRLQFLKVNEIITKMLK